MHEQYALSTDAEARLRDFLDSEENEHGLDYAGTHGFLCATTVGPADDSDGWLDTLFEGVVPQALVPDLLAWRKSLHACLYHEVVPEMPCALNPTDEALVEWCIGFMEAMFSREEDWYASDEQAIVEMTLPMVTISGLVEDPDIDSIRRNPKLMQQLAKQIPAILSDLYLHFHAPRTV